MKPIRALTFAMAALVTTALTFAALPRAQSLPAGATAAFYTGVSDAASLTSAVEQRLASARQHMERLLAVGGRRTPENTLRLYDDLRKEAMTAGGVANVVRQLHPDQSMRGIAEKLAQQITAFSTEVQLHRGVFDALAAIDLAHADADARRYVERELASFRRAGVDRDAATREALAGLRARHAGAMQDFDRNIREGVRRFTISSIEELAGLPPDFIASHRPDPAGVITLTTEAPDLQPVMLYAKSDELRRKMLVESQNVAYPQNVEVLQRLLAIRDEMARMLGYRSWAAYDIEERMAGSADAAGAFIDRVVAASAAKSARDYRQLLDRKRLDDPSAHAVEASERRYYTELVRQASYSFDSQAMRPYFAYERIRDGVLGVASRLFGFEFRPARHLPVWHPSVESYEVFEEGRFIGRIYLDMHPRDGKGGAGASASTVQPGVQGRQGAEVVLICRFPASQPGTPGLMTHDQVTTFFHEFGHLIHALSAGRQRWAGLTQVTERDFVEAPSQMLEEWAQDAATLSTFARHHQTNEPVPASLVQQLRRASELGRGYDVRQQMAFAKLSLVLHDGAPEGVDATALFKELATRYVPSPYPEGTHFPMAFTHLANPNYSAAYYTYMWSLVIAKDLASRFDRANLLEPRMARAYRNTILAAGGSKPAAQLVRDFLGREFNSAAWEAWLNQETR